MGKILSNEFKFLVDLNAHSLEVLSLEFDLQTEFLWQKDIKIKHYELKHPGSWALEISKSLGALEYLNPVGGKHLFNDKEFLESGINLRFITPRVARYYQGRKRFEPSLSVLDSILWNGVEGTEKIIKDENSVEISL